MLDYQAFAYRTFRDDDAYLVERLRSAGFAVSNELEGDALERAEAVALEVKSDIEIEKGIASIRARNAVAPIVVVFAAPDVSIPPKARDDAFYVLKYQVSDASLIRAVDRSAKIGRLRRSVASTVPNYPTSLTSDNAAAFPSKAFAAYRYDLIDSIGSASVAICGADDSTILDGAYFFAKAKSERESIPVVDVDGKLPTEWVAERLFGDRSGKSALDAKNIIVLRNFASLRSSLVLRLKRRFKSSDRVAANVVACFRSGAREFSSVAVDFFERKIKAPDAKDRFDDLLEFAEDVARRFANATQTEQKLFTKAAADKILRNGHYVGFDALRESVENAASDANDQYIDADDILFCDRKSLDSVSFADIPFDVLEKKAVVDTLAKHEGNRVKSARALSVSEKTIYNKIRQYKIKNVV